MRFSARERWIRRGAAVPVVATDTRYGRLTASAATRADPPYACLTTWETDVMIWRLRHPVLGIVLFLAVWIGGASIIGFGVGFP